MRYIVRKSVSFERALFLDLFGDIHMQVIVMSGDNFPRRFLHFNSSLGFILPIRMYTQLHRYLPFAFFSVPCILIKFDCCGLQVKSHIWCTKLCKHDGHLCRKLAANFIFVLIISICKMKTIYLKIASLLRLTYIKSGDNK